MQLQDSAERALSAKSLTIAINGNRYADAGPSKSGKPIELPRPSNPS